MSKSDGERHHCTAPDRWRALADFQNAIDAAGLGCPEVIPDGRLRRFRGEGDRPGARNCWYVLHLDGARPAGAFGSWRSGQSGTWTADRDHRLTAGELAAMRHQVAEARAARDAETRERQTQAADRAADLLLHSRPADPRHPYLAAKGIRPHGARQHGDRLLIPIFVDGALTSVQLIAPDGEKRFLVGGRIASGYHVIDDATTRSEVLICEGFATGATLHERTGATVVVAFNAGNLLSVARHVRGLHPSAPIIIAADNDAWTPGNPGLTAARKAAIEVGGRLLMPDFTGMDLSGRPTDWNDWFRLRDASAREVRHG